MIAVSLLSDGSSLCRVDIKLASTPFSTCLFVLRKGLCSLVWPPAFKELEDDLDLLILLPPL